MKFRKLCEFLIQSLYRMKQAVFSKHPPQSDASGLDIVDLPTPPPYVLSKQDTTSFLTGWGVYQGEATVIRSFGRLPPYRSSAIDKLQYLDLVHIDMDMVKKTPLFGAPPRI